MTDICNSDIETLISTLAGENLEQALFSVVRLGLTDAVSECLKKGVNINCQNGKAMRQAVASSGGTTDMVKHLIRLGFNIKRVEDDIISQAASLGYLPIVQYLVLEQDCNATFGIHERAPYNVFDWCIQYHNSKLLHDTFDKSVSKSVIPNNFREKI